MLIGGKEMTLVLVTEDGRYHGHTENESVARGFSVVKEGVGAKLDERNKRVRFLSEADWAQVVQVGNDKVKRAELCSTLGKSAA